MNGWQYQSRADALRARGLDVHEFGTRILRESSFGEDVLSLQAFLSQEGYYNPLDGGYTGYFGTVTKEALQAWQRDIGLEPTGVFDASARWAYLRQLEARQASEIATHSSFQAENVVIATAQPAVASHPLTQMQPPVNAGFPFFFAAAVLSGIALTRLLPSMMRGRFSNGGSLASGGQTTDAGMQPTMFQAPSQGNAAAHVQSDGLIDEVSALPSTLRRLSNDELQRYIAPMKGAVSSRTPLQRPAPRQLELSDVDGAVGHPTK
jgi:peptidoglycan hydrolase-like protein with peptidoglycan-binding domain